MRLHKEAIFEQIQDFISLDSVKLRHRTSVHIAVLMKRGKIFEVACNSVGSRSKGPGYHNNTIHAERAVLKKVGDFSKLAGAVLVVIRVGKNDEDVLNSKPCHSCTCHLEKAMKDYGLKSVYYST